MTNKFIFEDSNQLAAYKKRSMCLKLSLPECQECEQFWKKKFEFIQISRRAKEINENRKVISDGRRAEWPRFDAAQPLTGNIDGLSRRTANRLLDVWCQFQVETFDSKICKKFHRILSNSIKLKGN